MKIKALIRLCRPEQYYKNLVIFLAVFFSGNILQINYLFSVILGFISLSLMSSVNYIINDITDRENDRHNKEKSKRPLVTGEVTVKSSILLASFLFIISIILAYSLALYFLAADLLFFILSSAYSLFLKKEPFIDVIVISSNFVIRALSGAYIIRVWVSPWLIIGTFFLALFLATGKRKSESVFLRKKAEKHRPAMRFYSDDLLSCLMQISTTTLLLSYSLYCFLGNNQKLLLTLPFVLYILLRYLYLIYSGSDKTRFPSRIIKDKRILLASAIYALTTFLILYPNVLPGK
ncbi:UbiA prenyltransferase family protein [Candidatus Woesearchaeota archaeon]|nr:UbiA prenyltransferase family protein [Candidatus Woesearchaeota archaeon]